MLNLLFPAAILFLMAVPTAAYVLEGPHILNLMVKKIAGKAAVAASAKVTLVNPAPEGSPVSFYQQVEIRVPGMTRVAIQAPQRKLVRINSGADTLTVVNDQIIPSTVSIYDRYLMLFAFQTRKALQEWLMQQGVDVAVSSIGRYEDRLVYVVGAKYPDLTVSQIWVDKETFLPIRWVAAEPQKDGATRTMDAVYGNWQRVDKAWFPMTVSFNAEDVPRRVVTMTDVDMHPDLNAAAFDVAQIRAVLPESGENFLAADAFHPFEEKPPVTAMDADVPEDDPITERDQMMELSQ